MSTPMFLNVCEEGTREGLVFDHGRLLGRLVNIEATNGPEPLVVPAVQAQPRSRK